MRIRASKTRAISKFFFMLLLVGIFALFVHEMGHCLTAQALDRCRCTGMFVWPGTQVWPFSGFGDQYDNDWGSALGRASNDCGEKWGYESWQNGLIKLMGSGTNLILATISLISLWMLRPRGWLRYFLIAEALLFGDILLYTILPVWFCLPHFFFFGGELPESVIGAELLGWPRRGFITTILLLSMVLSAGWLGFVLLDNQTRNLHKRRSKMKERKTLFWIGLADVLVVTIGYFIWIDIFKGSHDGILALTLTAVAIITFFGFIALEQSLGGEWKLTKAGMRNAITVSVLTVYFVLLALIIFLKSPEKPQPLTETLVSNFTVVVGVVIAFFFGASAYVEVKEAHKEDGKGEEEQK